MAGFDIPTVDEANEARAIIEHYELARDKPEYFVAYIGKEIPNSGIGLDNLYPSRKLILWNGRHIGNCKLAQSWPVNSYIGSRMYQVYAIAFGREYTGRSFGAGMAVKLKETAESKRKRQCAQ